MTKKHLLSKLECSIAKYIVIALVISVLTSVLLYFGTQFIVFKASHKNKFFKQELNYMVNDLQYFITENGLTTENHEQLEEWNNENWFLFIRIFDEYHIIYDSLFSTKSVFISNSEQKDSYQISFPLAFADKDTTLVITAYFGGLHYRTLLKTGCYFFAFFLFLVIFMGLMKKKIKYIKRIEESIKIIESGSLEYKVPLIGDDELCSLALSINDMSLAMKERLKWEAEVKQQNYDIVTTISHDIRTPLTSVICYLDLIEDKKFRNEEERSQFLNNARRNAYQIKSLTDNLFEHSIASNENIPFHFESVSGNELIPQLISEMVCVLEEKGYKVSYFDDIDKPYSINVDITHFHRVFDNICSNILKYADENYYVDMTSVLEDGKLVVTQHNKVKQDQKEAESFSIGIRTCEDIIARHGGSLLTEQKEEDFTVRLIIKAN